jgi:hypothetical protein
LVLATARAPTARDRRRHSRVSAMAARSVGIANAALQAGKAPRRRGRVLSGREEVVVQPEQVAAVNLAVGVAAVVAAMSAAGAAAVWAVMGAAGGDEPGEGRTMPSESRLQVISKS